MNEREELLAERERTKSVNKELVATAFELAWHAFQHTGIDLVGDSDDETCRCVHNAIVAYLTATWRDGLAQEAPDLLKQPQYIAEGIILRRLHEKRIEGYTLEMSREIASAIAGRRAQEWRPIETAPKDGEYFSLFWCPEDSSRWVANWQGGRWYGVDDLGITREGASLGDPDVVTGWFVSHWQPLPEGPPIPSTSRSTPSVDDVPSCGQENDFRRASTEGK